MGWRPVVDLKRGHAADDFVRRRVEGKRDAGRERRPLAIVLVGKMPEATVSKPPEDLNGPVASGVVRESGGGLDVGCLGQEVKRLRKELWRRV